MKIEQVYTHGREIVHITSSDVTKTKMKEKDPLKQASELFAYIEQHCKTNNMKLHTRDSGIYILVSE